MLNSEKLLNTAFNRLSRWIQQNGLKGYDPYDGLNSKLFQALPFKPRVLRLAWIQFLKNCPVNLRKILFIPKTLNPKGLALLADGFLFQYQVYHKKEQIDQVIHLLQLLEKESISGYSGFCWGYPFDWQSRMDFKPKKTPTVVTTAFVADTFVHAYLILGNKKYLNIARSACDFIVKDLNRQVDDHGFSFSYSPFDKAVVHNANMLAAHLLVKVSYHKPEEHELKEAAEQAVRYVIKYQNSNGSWFYGTESYQKWIDNFHTGYILEFLYEYIKLTDSVELLKYVKKGLDFYLNNLFLSDGRPKYYVHQSYPIDIHCCAQAIIVLSQLQHLNPTCELILDKVIRWTVKYMQSPEGYFYYRKYPGLIIKIPYFRWGESWMFKALSYAIMKQQMEKKISYAENKFNALAK